LSRREEDQPALIETPATPEEMAEARRNRERFKVQHAEAMAHLERIRRERERWW
jgi:hypothetical protein